MKKLKFLFLFSLVVLNLSCEEDKVVFNGSSSRAAFGEVGQNLKVAIEDNSFIKVRVDLTTTSKEDRVVAISVDQPNTTATSDMYTIDQTSLVVPAGAYNAEIIIKGNYDAIQDAQKYRLVLNLDSVDGAYIDAKESQHIVIISQSCPKDAGGKYDVFVSALNEEAPSHQVTFVPVSGIENTFDITTSWGPNFVGFLTGDPSYNGQFVYPGRITINCDNSILFVGTDANGAYDAGGSGFFDEDSGVLEITLNQALFQDSFTATCTFVPVIE